MDKFLLFPPIFWKVVRRGGGGRFIWVLFACLCNSSWMPFDPGHSPCAKRLDRGETLKHHFQTDAVASSWLNQSRDDRKSKTRPRNKHQIIRQIRVLDRRKSIHESQEIYTTRRAWRHTFTKSDRVLTYSNTWFGNAPMGFWMHSYDALKC